MTTVITSRHRSAALQRGSSGRGEQPGLPPGRASGRVSRALHPVAWWAWAIAVAVAVSRTTNPVLIMLAFVVLATVVVCRRSSAPWARGLPYYLGLALVVVGLRVALRIVFGGDVIPGDHILLTLPRVPLPGWLAGVQVGGPVSTESIRAAVVDGLRLACLLCCVGAANVLADPRRLLRCLPGALYELGVTVVLAVNVAPQLVASATRVRRARRLRGSRGRGVRALPAVVVPVLADALDRSLALAAAMDSRGYGRSAGQPARTRRLTAGLLLAGILGLAVGGYGLLASGASSLLGLPMLAAGGLGCVAGLTLGGRRVRATRYRPDPWRADEWLVIASGVLAAAAVVAAGALDPAALDPAVGSTLAPGVPLLAVAGLAVAALAAVLSPPPPRPLRCADPTGRGR